VIWAAQSALLSHRLKTHQRWVAQSPEDGLALNACWAALSAAFFLVTESAQLGLIATPFYVFVGMVVTA